MLGHGLSYLFQMMLLDAVVATPTAPYFDNGALLLQNQTDGLWYFWRLDHDGPDLIHLPDQTPTAPPVGAAPRIAFVNQTDGLNYYVQLFTDTGIVSLHIGQTPTAAAGVASITLEDEVAAPHDVEMINDPTPILSFV